MKEKIQKLKRASFLHKWYKRNLRKMMDNHGCFIKFPPYDSALHQLIISTRDPVRYSAIALALQSIADEKIPGHLAEVGVYRGDTSRIIRRGLPQRTFYLFDTFEGFSSSDLDEKDERFRDTNLDLVKKNIGHTEHLEFRVGYFPETARGLEQERFSFVLLDVDKLKPTLAGLDFFYPRLSRGAYVFIHDYNSPESQYAVRKAVGQFMKDKPEQIMPLPDAGGSIVFRKI
jgi:O-methyltransferase